MDHLEWVRRHYAESAVALDSEAFVEGLGEDVRMSRGVTVVVGREEIRKAFAQMQTAGLQAIKHDIAGLWEPEPGVVIAEATVAYEYTTGATPAVPVVSVFRWDGDEVVDIRVYMDSAQAPQSPS
ncbi:nuclear transport factor 2 family protein [Streptomyces sp. NPDC047061]|uniref:nuclear transport factor 2 family protein n=1 Tax=Streptomyces sp. NPDC047061 TaxID=3154605 RepID=UPI0033DFA0B1